ncbi:hypothetical protein Rhopal_004932-T1 [Rhodotorula paludigena]|uniref:SP-RING-type domain-containing protein n=1 Tax=Rhodotorula paludigena TaxID=86838 RepID=A0AAV5GQZ7_9BASI|nr:hypothetical protein Rhopal_004932-T1 [Rhodotorula paludigena]
MHPYPHPQHPDSSAYQPPALQQHPHAFASFARQRALGFLAPHLSGAAPFTHPAYSTHSAPPQPPCYVPYGTFAPTYGQDYLDYAPPPPPQQQPSPALSASHSPELGAASFGQARRSPSPFTDLQLEHQRLEIDYTMSSDAVAFHEAVRDLGHLTVDKLKAAIRNSNSHLSLHIRMSGKKADLHDALLTQLNAEYLRYDKQRFRDMKRIIANARTSTGGYSSLAYNGAAARGTWVGPGYGSNNGASTSANGYGSVTGSYSAGGSGGTTPYGGGSATPGYRAGTAAGGAGVSGGLPPPRFGAGAGATSSNGYGGATPGASAGMSGSGGGAWTSARAHEIPIRFRPSPFFRVDKSLSGVTTLAKATPGDRKTSVISLQLTEAQRALLAASKESPSNPQYQVRLYCTSDTNYNPLRPSAGTQYPAPVEFPLTCEIKLNGVTVNANTKGIKKQPGTAPPVNLSGKAGAAVALTAGAMNRIEFIYINTEKTYYLIAYLVEYTPVPTVVSRVKAGKTKSKDEVIGDIVKLNSDEDVEASSFGLSLKDPLSFMRIDIPIRSQHCDHIACFDASTWFEVNEQTPQWQCPICSKTLKVDDMVVDGYLEDILKICSSSVESVTVEPDGTWRSDNNKFGTAKPRSVAGSAVPSGRSTPLPPSALASGSSAADGGDGANSSADEAGAGDGKGKPRASEALLLSDDSDDDDMPLAKRPRLVVPSSASGSATPFSTASANGGGGGGLSKRREVVDLTLDSEDEDAPPPPPPPPPARAATSMGATTLGITAAGAAGRPSLEMARTGSSADRKSVAEVQADIDVMEARMVREHGPDWRKTFGY